MLRGVTVLIRTTIAATTRAIDVALALPRIAVALERLADAAEDLRRIADVTPAIETIAALAAEAKRLLGDPARYAELTAAIAAIGRLGEAATTVGPLADAVRQLNAATATLTSTVTPLQGASERFGRFVERFPTAKPRPEPDLA